MSRELRDYELDDLKLVYRALHARLAQSPELMDSDLLHDLQSWLQRQAAIEGVSVTEHAQWDAWLRNRHPASPPPKTRPLT